MKLWQAQATLIYIDTQYHGRIAAAIDDGKVQRGGTGYSVALLCLVGQRRINTPFVESVKSILLAWEVAYFHEA